MTARASLPIRIALASLALILGASSLPQASTAGCESPGWFPSGFGVKDHAVFHYDGVTYIAAIQLPEETQFAYARSFDHCEWVELGPILSERTEGDWDEFRIWAPYVLEEVGTWYMFYTGVNDQFAQSIMLATTPDPSDPGSWEEQGMVFQPSHPGAVWSPTSWSDNRDPMVVKLDDTYYLYYTGRDIDGGIVGLATATSPYGPWTDHGATLGTVPGRIFESPTLFMNFDTAYLLYHDTTMGQSNGGAYRSGSTIVGPWSPASTFFPGWAHEVWRTPDGSWYSSYLSSYSISIAPLGWDTSVSPPVPFIDIPIFKAYSPFIARSP